MKSLSNIVKNEVTASVKIVIQNKKKMLFSIYLDFFANFEIFSYLKWKVLSSVIQIETKTIIVLHAHTQNIFELNEYLI